MMVRYASEEKSPPASRFERRNVGLLSLRGGAFSLWGVVAGLHGSSATPFSSDEHMPDGRPIYLDYNATTPIDPAVREAMLPYLQRPFRQPVQHPPLRQRGTRRGRDGPPSRSPSCSGPSRTRSSSPAAGPRRATTPSRGPSCAPRHPTGAATPTSSSAPSSTRRPCSRASSSRASAAR